jgi:GntR family transcriptional regulator of vanillate catabolism
MDPISRRKAVSSSDIALYAASNDRFHHLVGSFARSPNLMRQLDRASSLPFASPSSLIPAQSKVLDLPTILVIAQDQHHCIVDAIEERDGTRAEALMREHARLTTRHLHRVFHGEASALIPGHRLFVEDKRPPAPVPVEPPEGKRGNALAGEGASPLMRVRRDA